MKTFPMFLTMTGRRVVILGGGEQAAQKTRLMLKTEARIEILADELDPELADLARDGRVAQISGAADVFSDTALVFVATGCAGADAAWHALAKSAGAVVNVVDRPDLCDAMTPSIVDRDPVVVAIGTEGAAPVLARQIKTRMEELLEPRLGDLAALAARLRAEVAHRVAQPERRALWRWVFGGAPRRLHATGAEREAARLIKQAIAAGKAPEVEAGTLSLVGANPSPDLMTLRGVQRMQEADVIFHDRALGTALLELARRDAERVSFAGDPSAEHWPVSKTVERAIAHAARGERVVILTPSLADLDGVTPDGVSVERVQGVSAPDEAATALRSA
ncbi:MAG: NAD(P)-dependent oxidoreductase [Pseudomonadota bacterium]